MCGTVAVVFREILVTGSEAPVNAVLDEALVKTCSEEALLSVAGLMCERPAEGYLALQSSDVVLSESSRSQPMTSNSAYLIRPSS